MAQGACSIQHSLLVVRWERLNAENPLPLLADRLTIARVSPGPRTERAMQISERIINDVTILDLEGRITINDGAELLRDKVRSIVFQGRTKLLINLAKVPYIDSGGLGELVRCSLSAKKANGAVKLMGLNGKITDLLAITRLVTIFETFDTELDALASFGETPVQVRA
jgi:anti-sigma B factor antagonist